MAALAPQPVATEMDLLEETITVSLTFRTATEAEAAFDAFEACIKGGGLAIGPVAPQPPAGGETVQ